MAEIITGGIAGFFFSLNMLGYVSISCKDLSVDSRVIALLFTFLCIGLAAACKTLSLKDKLRQRTIEFWTMISYRMTGHMKKRKQRISWKDIF